MTGAHQGTENRSPDELRADVDELRAEIGETVAELAYRADVPARAREKRDETVQRVQAQVGRAQAVVTDKAPALKDPRVLAGIGTALVALLVLLRRRST